MVLLPRNDSGQGRPLMKSNMLIIVPSITLHTVM